MFPYFPIKWRYSPQLIVFLAILLALRFLTQVFTLPIGPVLRLSLNWVPSSLIGWTFGPVFGIFIGAAVDTLTFFWGGGVWYWMYAIQEPLIMMLAGVVGGVFRLRENARTWLADYCAFQLVATGFVAIAAAGLVNYASAAFADAPLDALGLPREATIYVTWVAMALFYGASQTVVHVMAFRRRARRRKLIFCLYVCMLAVLLSIVFSFTLGTLAAIGFVGYVSNGAPATGFAAYGAYWYLIPRVVKETFKLPLTVACLSGMIGLADPYLRQIKKLSCQKW